MERVLILGATDPVAEAAARLWAERGARLCLAAPALTRLEAIAADLRVRGAEGAQVFALDPRELARHAAVIAEADAGLGGIDLALIAPEDPPEPRGLTAGPEPIRAAFEASCLGTLSQLTALAALLGRRGSGALAVLTSVAGDRGRPSDCLQGAASAALVVYLQGLRADLARSGVSVLTVKVGPLAGRLASEARGGLLRASPRQVARGVLRAVQRRRELVYLPGAWRAIAWALRNLPEAVLKRLPA